MQWTKKSAHLVLQMRTQVLDERLEDTFVIGAMAVLRVANVCYGDQPMRGEFLNEPDHMAPGTVKLIREDLKRGPSVAFTAREIGQIGIEFLGLFRDFRTLFKPLRQPYAMKQAMGINKFRSVASELTCYVFCYDHT